MNILKNVSSIMKRNLLQAKMDCSPCKRKNLSTFLLFNLSTLLVASAFAGDDFVLAQSTWPIDIVVTNEPSAWSVTNASSLYLESAIRLTGDDLAVSTDNNGSPAMLLSYAACGDAISERHPDFYLGD